MSEANVGKFGLVKRDEMIAEMEAERDKSIAQCVADVEAARTMFIYEVDKACYADGSKLDADDIALLNANAVIKNDIRRLLDKHADNFTMLKAIKSYVVRNNISGISEDGNADSILVAGEVEEASLREFAQNYFDMCVSAVNVGNGYNAMLLLNRDAMSQLLRDYGLIDTINISAIRIREKRVPSSD